MKILDMLDEVERKLKHQPGRHSQQSHAGSRGAAFSREEIQEPKSKPSDANDPIPSGWDDLIGDGTYVQGKHNGARMQVWVQDDPVSPWAGNVSKQGKPIYTGDFGSRQEGIDWAMRVAEAM
jgi:hypothetical protein